MKLTGSHGYVEGVVEHETGMVRSAEFVSGNKLYVDYGEGQLSLESADGFHFKGQYVEPKGDRGEAEFELYKGGDGNLLFFGRSRSKQGTRDYTWWIKLKPFDQSTGIPEGKAEAAQIGPP